MYFTLKFIYKLLLWLNYISLIILFMYCYTYVYTFIKKINI